MASNLGLGLLLDAPTRCAALELGCFWVSERKLVFRGRTLCYSVLLWNSIHLAGLLSERRYASDEGVAVPQFMQRKG